jgi:hypothetical protein
MCRYFNGEKENPYEQDSNAGLCWFYESKWFEMNESNSKILDGYLDDYSAIGLISFEHFDKTPITLKALLFDRFAKGYDSRIFAIDDYKKWYIESYMGKH